MLSKAREMVAESEARVAELEKQVDLMKRKRVGETTTPEDVFETFPDMEGEIEEEIEGHQWQKDIA